MGYFSGQTAGDLQVAVPSSVIWMFRAQIAEIFLGFYCCCLFSVGGNSSLEILSTKYAGSQSTSGARVQGSGASTAEGHGSYSTDAFAMAAALVLSVWVSADIP